MRYEYYNNKTHEYNQIPPRQKKKEILFINKRKKLQKFKVQKMVTQILHNENKIKTTINNRLSIRKISAAMNSTYLYRFCDNCTKSIRFTYLCKIYRER